MDAIPLGLLATVFGTLSPMSDIDARRRAELAVETLTATKGRSDIVQLGLALRSLEVAPLNAASGGLTRFSSADQRARERILLSWSTSPIPQLRTAFQALKRLGLFLAYADPGPDPTIPSNAAWDRIGYRPADPEVPAAPRLRPMDVAAGGEPLRLEADVVVVGSGPGGSVVAARLAETGRAVLVLEAGPHRSEAAMPRLEAEAWRDLLLERGAAATDDLGVTIFAGATVGGGSTVNWTTSFAPPDWLRDEWEAQHGLDGLTDAQTDADIARLSDELELMPPTVVPAKDRLIIDGARALGWEADVTHRNAGPCEECGACTFGCRIGAKRSAARAHLAAAQARGARLLAEARVTRVLVEAGRARGVVGRLGRQARPFRVDATQVVVAGGALRTPAILARSGVRHPELGRNLRLHPTVAVAARMAHPVDMWRGPLQAARSLEFSRPGEASGDGIGPAHGGFVIESAPAHPGLAAAAFPWAGRAANTDLLGGLRHMAPLIGIVRDQGSGRVGVDRAGRSRATYRVGRGDAATVRRALVEMARLARAGGAAEVLSLATPPHSWADGADFDAFLRAVAVTDTGPNRVSVFSAHQMGTARAGGDPRRHPCDPWGAVRGVAGLSIADASLFPTASGVNPMLTVMVLADRVARRLAQGG